MPRLGATCEGGGIRFCVWAPQRNCVEVVLESGPNAGSVHALPALDALFSGVVGAAGVGDRYRYRLDGEGPYPDPASRFQPEGVHGPSEIIDPTLFGWSDVNWTGVHLSNLSIYELHVGTFGPNGTFGQVTERLPYLRDLGVAAIELMPVADFPGTRNWGYDGVALFAPARCYGRPDDLRRLVNVAHGLGLGVILDVVYNHLGPDGNYLNCFSPFYFSKHHLTPWGDAVNLDGPHCGMVRELFFQNAVHWLREYHIDGLRLDATHALIDEGPRHFVAELTSRVRESIDGREAVVIAEDQRNLSSMLRPETEGGWDLDAVWADDFHHQMRRILAGDHEGYYAEYSASMDDLATALREGWLRRDPVPVEEARLILSDDAVERQRLVICIENHDQVGNRAFGDRLHHEIDLAAYRAASVLLFCAPETPLLFMG
ncbi:MAG TPA: alpha-amylase family glycosyl hydrolase, partial [Candidatus Acidoferrales bacterium]|nr:alpha-amylase family glycosyl hydrolase [Candidatus Acidoferrales bacterium]